MQVLPMGTSLPPPALTQGRFGRLFEEQNGINRQWLKLIAAVTVTAQSWQRARLLSLAPGSSEERPD